MAFEEEPIGSWEEPMGDKRKPAGCSLQTRHGLRQGASCGLAMATGGRSILRMEATAGGCGGGEEARLDDGGWEEARSAGVAET